MTEIRKNRNNLKELFGTGRIRQILELCNPRLSEKEVQMVIDAVSEKYKF